MKTELVISLPEQWITVDKFEQALKRASIPSFFNVHNIVFRIPSSCKIMVESAVRLLSLANQLIAEETQVTIIFEGEQNDTMSYLNRANFFTLLSEQVLVLPIRPHSTYPKRYMGQSKNLVEFKSIGTDYDEKQMESLPSQLSDALEVAMEAHPDRKSLSRAAYTIFAELITNVHDHSQTVLDGFAALQVYPQGGRVQVVVSDSGIGLLETLKPKLLIPSTRNLIDAELIRLLFCDDLDWNRKGKGMGLVQCAEVALKCKGSVEIRLATGSVGIKYSQNGYKTANIRYQHDLVLLKGTHICFSFPLDSSP